MEMKIGEERGRGGRSRGSRGREEEEMKERRVAMEITTTTTATDPFLSLSLFSSSSAKSPLCSYNCKHQPQFPSVTETTTICGWSGQPVPATSPALLYLFNRYFVINAFALFIELTSVHSVESGRHFLSAQQFLGSMDHTKS